MIDAIKLMNEMAGARKSKAGKQAAKTANKAVNEAEKARRLAQSVRDRQKLMESASSSKEMVSKALNSQKALEMVELSQSHYLRTRLDPEAYGPCAYPDEYGDDVTLGKFIVRKDVPFDSEGNFFCWASPTLRGILRMNQDGVGLSKSIDHMVQYQVPVVSGGGDSWPSVMPINTTNWGDIGFQGGFFGDDTEEGETQLQVLDRSKIMLPVGYTSTTFTVVAASPTTYKRKTPTWQIILSDNSVTSVTPGTPYVIAAGKEWLKIQVKAESGYSPDYLESAAFNITATIPSTGSTFVSYDVADLSNLLGYDNTMDPDSSVPPLYEEWRPVAFSVLVSFSGSTIYNGGRIAGRYLAGGETPGGIGVTNYATLASKPRAYDGPVKTGAYGWWKPTDTKDVGFIDPGQDNATGDLPSLLFAGKVTDPTNAQVSIRICLIAEAKTTVQVLPTEKSRVCPAEIAFANAAVQNLPFVMENPTHVRDVARFLADTVKKAEDWWKRNGDTVSTVAKKVATYAPMVLAALG